MLALGGCFKNTVCVTRGDEAFVSQHIGDLDNAPTCARAGSRRSRTCASILDVEPQVVAHDLHPDFFSTRLAARARGALGRPGASPCSITTRTSPRSLAEHRVDGPVLGLALDGVGLGTDGAAWGGELLHVDGARCERLGHLRPLRLPGGDRAAREPWRMAAAALARARPRRRDRAALRRRAGGGAPSRRCSRAASTRRRRRSMGRWFDAAAGLLGVRAAIAFEGQAAMLLEGLAEAHGRGRAATLALYAIAAANELDLRRC